jgi:hypothetical protein
MIIQIYKFRDHEFVFFSFFFHDCAKHVFLSCFKSGSIDRMVNESLKS